MRQLNACEAEIGHALPESDVRSHEPKVMIRQLAVQGSV